MFKQIIVLVLAVCSASAVQFQDCGSTATVHALRIPGCTVQPCVLRRGALYNIEMDVTASEYKTNITLNRYTVGIKPLINLVNQMFNMSTHGKPVITYDQ